MTPALPYPALPYAAAPAWCFPGNEIAVYILFLLCLWHARKRGPQAVAYLLGGAVFGLLLEYFEVMTDSYVYGRFWIMLGRAPHDIPFWVGCAWGIIMYTARLFSDAVRLPLLAAAAFDTLLALNIDLSIDVVAYRTHMWHWSWVGTTLDPLTAQWFGIPYGNFNGWITVVFCYSIFSRLFELWADKRAQPKPSRSAFIAALSILSSLAVLVLTETAIYPIVVHLGLTGGRRLLLSTTILLVLTIIGWKAKAAPAIALSPTARWVPCWFHFFFVFCFFALGFYRENPWMTAAAIVNVTIGVVLHLEPKTLLARSSAPATFRATD
jgi:hypothetical protein